MSGSIFLRENPCLRVNQDAVWVVLMACFFLAGERHRKDRSARQSRAQVMRNACQCAADLDHFGRL